MPSHALKSVSMFQLREHLADEGEDHA
jgi:hypothetical protein